jgi:hypothetical protein
LSKLLYDHGADIHAEDDYAVRLAEVYDYIEVVQWLQAHGGALKSELFFYEI